jgi:hypothetical protein
MIFSDLLPASCSHLLSSALNGGIAANVLVVTPCRVRLLVLYINKVRIAVALQVRVDGIAFGVQVDSVALRVRVDGVALRVDGLIIDVLRHKDFLQVLRAEAGFLVRVHPEPCLILSR